MNEVMESFTKMVNDEGNTSFDISRINAAIFVRKSKEMMNEKVQYLSNILNSEAKRFDQNMLEHNKCQVVLREYRNKMIRVYNEYYIQYVNIQGLLDEAKTNQKVIIINAQKIVNDREQRLKSQEYQNFLKERQMLNYKLKLSNTSDEYNKNYEKISKLKSPVKDIKPLLGILKEKYNMYEEIISKCSQQLSLCTIEFKQNIDSFWENQKYLQKIEENNIFAKIKNKILNIFVGNKKFEEIVGIYREKINQIDEKIIINKINDDTINFVSEIMGIQSEEDVV